MTNVRLAFYKYDKKIINWIISKYTSFFTWGIPSYSHVELGILIDGEWKYFSSTLRDGAKGTRWISEKKLFKHIERWDIYKYKSNKSEEEILERIRSIIPAKYDLLGLFGFILPFNTFNLFKSWYCSEACWYVLFEWKKRISPKRMYKLLKKDLVLVQ